MFSDENRKNCKARTKQKVGSTANDNTFDLSSVSLQTPKTPRALADKRIHNKTKFQDDPFPFCDFILYVEIYGLSVRLGRERMHLRLLLAQLPHFLQITHTHERGIKSSGPIWMLSTVQVKKELHKLE